MPPATSRAERALELHRVSKYFGDVAALRNVSLRFVPGESVLVYGPNGAGKTTLLRTLAGLARPSEGEVRFEGRNLIENSAAPKKALGFVSHSSFLYGELSPRENLRFTGRLFGLQDLDRAVNSALDRFGLGARADEPVRTLSRGLVQRTSLARAFLHDPTFLLLDEPFTGLDATSVKNLELLLAELVRQGKALILSNHNFEQGAALAHRLVELDGGRLKYDGLLEGAPRVSEGGSSLPESSLGKAEG
jgi:heme exporter protein A